jgi:UDP-4-amino-4,6-dideoxy-N-acetyl-beta-L-altrosamine transaminase
MIPYGKHSISALDVFRVAKQMYFSSLTQGPQIKKFEESIAHYVGAKYAVAVSSATAGLHLALTALNLPKGSEVLTSPVSFVSSSNAALYNELTPKFIDINLETISISQSLTLKEIEKNQKLSAIIPVHFAGYVDDISLLSQNAKKQNIKIIEDAAHALGSIYPSGEMVGSCRYSDLTVFSFHPVKTITTGEGGVITTNDQNLYRDLISLRSHGINQVVNIENNLLAKTDGEINPWYYEMQNLGFHYRLTEIQATLGISQLKRINTFLNKRRKLMKFYVEFFAGKNNIEMALKKWQNSACHLAVLKINFSKLKINRLELINTLKKLNIVTQVHYKPIPLNPYYVNLGFDTYNLPQAMTYYEQCLSIPIFPELKLKSASKVAQIIAEVIDSNSE